MAYQVLARTYRPMNFTDLVGQDHISETLLNAIKTQRVGHAYLFVGSRGTGKTTSARIFAKALNCETPLPNGNPCGQCLNCREITEGSSLDVREIDGASNNKVEHIREIRDNVQFSPARCKYKIYIIDEAHMLTTQAWNALLKTLEEPPEHVKFFFATTEVHKVIPTILSRCQRFDLKRLAINTISQRLHEIAGIENIAIEDNALTAIARAANGGMRDALSILDQMIAFCSNAGKMINENDVTSVFGMSSTQELASITTAILNNDASTLIANINTIADQGKNLELLYGDLLQYSRNLLICKFSAQNAQDILEIDQQAFQTTMALAQQCDEGRIQRVVDGLLDNDGKIRHTLNKRVFLEVTLIKVMREASAVSLDAVLAHLQNLKKKSPDSLDLELPTPPTITLPKASEIVIAPAIVPNEPIQPAALPSPQEKLSLSETAENRPAEIATPQNALAKDIQEDNDDASVQLAVVTATSLSKKEETLQATNSPAHESSEQDLQDPDTEESEEDDLEDEPEEAPIDNSPFAFSNPYSKVSSSEVQPKDEENEVIELSDEHISSFQAPPQVNKKAKITQAPQDFATDPDFMARLQARADELAVAEVSEEYIEVIPDEILPEEVFEPTKMAFPLDAKQQLPISTFFDHSYSLKLHDKDLLNIFTGMKDFDQTKLTSVESLNCFEQEPQDFATTAPPVQDPPLVTPIETIKDTPIPTIEKEPEYETAPVESEALFVKTEDPLAELKTPVAENAPIAEKPKQVIPENESFFEMIEREFKGKIIDIRQPRRLEEVEVDDA